MQLDIGKSVALVATLAAGLLAGILVGTGLKGLTERGLPEPSWVLGFQLEDRLFSRLMPPAMLGTLLALAAACVATRGHSRLLFAASVVFMLIVLVVTIGFEVPLNRKIQSWTPGSAPAEWQQVRDLWLIRHLVRTAAIVLSFMCALSAVAL